MTIGIQMNKEKYYKDYISFRNKLKNFENERLIYEDSEIESIKCLLNDWIIWTSNKNLNEMKYSYFNGKNQQEIDSDDLLVFKNYLFYLLNVKKDFEKLRIIFKIFKRLILKNGSFEWIETYKEFSSSIQSEFYENYDFTINLD